ncbi:TonB-dependent receptor [Caulobacter rhizosphaerae]|uniref:TonB-dependent receptor n=1 Tax=Caulobacter rhizosphaerae TaxID=2010972 RepID=A0ABU1MW13_9CAUL|nr:TonB-dependent receptor [Caulobacter rhizosphaerae]
MSLRTGSMGALRVALLSATVIGGLPALAAAQESAAPQAASQGDTLDAVVVTGFKQSYANAVRAKKNAIEITDGISSDGLGRFPDLNVGEALQRIPGVQINREAEGRDATINLRGMPGEYARNTLNGQSFAGPALLRDNQGSPLGAFNSDIFSAFVIQKSPMANTVSGGLSGNVDLQIAPALSRKDGGFAKLSYEHNTLGDLNAPAATLGYNKHLTDDLAVFGTIAYKKENFRRDTIRLNNYDYLTSAMTGLTPTQFNAAYGQYFSPTACALSATSYCRSLGQALGLSQANASPYVTSNTGSKGTNGVWANSAIRQYTRMNVGKVWSGSAGFEWKPNDNTKIGLIGFKTDRNLPDTTQYFMINYVAPSSTPGAGTVITPTGTPIQTNDGRYLYESYTFNNINALSSTRLYSQRQKSDGVIGNVDWSNEDWRFAGALTLSSGSNASVETEVDVNNYTRPGGNGVSGSITTGLDDIGGFQYTTSPTPQNAIASGQTWTWGGANDPTSFYNNGTSANSTNQIQIQGTESFAKNELNSVALDVERFVSLGPIKSVQAGVRLEREKYVSTGYRVYAYGAQLSKITSSMMITAPFVKDFMGGSVDGYSHNWQVLNVHDFLDAVRPVTPYQSGGLSTQGFNIQYADSSYYDKNFTNENDINQFYVQAKYDTQIFGHGVRGNFGGRYEDTDNTITTLDRVTPPTDSIGSPNDFKTDEYKNKYHYFLPSAIFVADVTDDLILRGAYYKTYVRPHPRQYSPSTKVNPAQILNNSLSSGSVNVYDVSVAIGNNKLRPYLAESFDLSLEWYNRPNGLISLAYFRKNITGRIASTSDPALLCPADGSTWGFGALSWDGTYCNATSLSSASKQVHVNASGAYNLDKKTTVEGVEFNIQQNLDFLPGFLANLGGSFNYAYTMSKSPAIAPFPGISKHNVNVIGYYETPKYGVRMVYNYRSDYPLNANGTYTGGARSVKPRGQLDLSASYNVTDNFTLSLDAYNLTNAKRFEYENDHRVSRWVDYDGRTYTLTARATF